MEKRKKRNYKAKQQKKIAQTIRTVSREIPLTETDRITYVYARDKTKDAIREIINVSYEAWIEKSWLTILRYDSTHGYLHQHTRFSLTQEKEFISKSTSRKRAVIKNGSPGQSGILKRIFWSTDRHFSTGAIFTRQKSKVLTLRNYYGARIYL